MKEPSTTTPADEIATGIPWLKTWKGAYLFVVASFVLWVLSLVVLGVVFQ